MKTRLLLLVLIFFALLGGNVFACGHAHLSYGLFSVTEFQAFVDTQVTCKYCGRSAPDAKMLRNLGVCPNSPSRKHVALRGRKTRNTYVCRYCGKTSTSIRLLTAGACPSNPNGKRHVPAN